MRRDWVNPRYNQPHGPWVALANNGSSGICDLTCRYRLPASFRPIPRVRRAPKTHTTSPPPPAPKETSNVLADTATARHCHRCEVRCAKVLCCLCLVGGTSLEAVVFPTREQSSRNRQRGAPASVARRVRLGRLPAQHLMANPRRNPLAHCVKCACCTTCKNNACMA